MVYGDFAVEAGVAGCELVAHCGGGCGVDGGSGVLVAVVVVAVVVLGVWWLSVAVRVKVDRGFWGGKYHDEEGWGVFIQRRGRYG